jgi:hypothetical protein
MPTDRPTVASTEQVTELAANMETKLVMLDSREHDLRFGRKVDHDCRQRQTVKFTVRTVLR